MSGLFGIGSCLDFGSWVNASFFVCGQVAMRVIGVGYTG